MHDEHADRNGGEAESRPGVRVVLGVSVEAARSPARPDSGNRDHGGAVGRLVGLAVDTSDGAIGGQLVEYAGKFHRAPCRHVSR